MDLVEQLRQASRLRFDISLHYKLDALSRTQEERDRSTTGICLKKTAGKLEFLLNTSVLGIAALESDFDILFAGTKLAADAIRWDASLPAGPAAIKTTIADATITGLNGSFQSTLTAIAPPLSDTSCSGEQLGFVIQLATTDGSGSLHVDVDAGFAEATLEVSDLVVTGQAGEKENFSVRIQQHPKSECISAAIEGQPASFFALVSGVPQSAPLSYAWSIDGGATILGPSTSASLTALMPTPPDNVQVSVLVTVTNANSQEELSDARYVSIITEQLAKTMTHFCKLFMLAPINRFIRPLWDPLRDLVTRPMTAVEAEDLRSFSQRLNTFSAQIARLHSMPERKVTTRQISARRR